MAAHIDLFVFGGACIVAAAAVPIVHAYGAAVIAAMFVFEKSQADSIACFGGTNIHIVDMGALTQAWGGKGTRVAT